MTTLVVLGTFLFIFLLVPSGKEAPKVSKIKLDDPFYKKYNAEGLALVKDLEKHYLGGSVPENFLTKEYLSKFLLVFDYLDDSFITMNLLYTSIGIEKFQPEIGSDEYKAQQHFMNLIVSLSTRKGADEDDTYKGMGEQQAAEEHNINLFQDEVLIKTMYHTTWKEEKTRTTSVSYGGVRMSVGKGALKSVYGHMNITRHQETYFDTFDTGTIHITNKRVIFVGDNNRNKTIRMDRILNVDMFKDGIYLGKENGISPMITFSEYKDNDKEPWSYTQDLISRVPEIATNINRVLHNDVEIVVG
jgi:hypothetical protein